MNNQEIIIREAKTSKDFEGAVKILSQLNLKYEDNIDHTVLLLSGDEIIATGSVENNIIKCIGVREDYRSMDLNSKIISSLIDYLHSKKIYHYFIYTRPENEDYFLNMGFSRVIKINEENGVVLLEGGNVKIDTWLEQFNIEDGYNDCGGIVMNCNPMSKGHLFLIEEASKQVEFLYVFLVSSDISVFPFRYRKQIMEEATAEMKNVKILETGFYQVSQTIFPTYFTREKSEATILQTRLDVSIFGKWFGNRFNIKKRFVGTEPYCRTTLEYNKAMSEILPEFGIELVIIDRKKLDGNYISATRVRDLLVNGEIEKAYELLPEATIKFLNSTEGKNIIDKMKQAEFR